MKKKILALAALATIASVAMAEEDGIKIYGIADAGVAHMTNTLPGNSSFPATFLAEGAQSMANPNVGNYTSLANGPISDPRIGFSGNKNISGGFHAGFNLESGIDLVHGRLNSAADALAQNAGSTTAATASANSSLNGQIFNRSAYASVGKDGWGDLRIGRNMQFAGDIFGKLDPVQNAQLFSPFGYSGSLGGSMGISDNLRADQSLKYMNKIGNINFGLMYEFGNGTSLARQGRGTGLNLGYDDKTLNVQFAAQSATDVMKETADTSTANTLDVKAYNTKGWVLAASYKVSDALNIKGGYETYTLSAATDTITKSTYGGSLWGFALGSVASSTSADAQTNVWWVGGDYAVAPQTRLYTGYYSIQPQATGTSIAVKNNMFSLLLDYNLDESKDAYVGYAYTTYSNTTDGSTSPNNGAYANSSNFAVGFRYKF